jgi:murein DD-endopeptidase MepM/ murein hydrolase activator NlpD
VFQSYVARTALAAAVAAVVALPAQPATAVAKKRAAADAAAAFAGVPRARHADGAIVERGDTGHLVRKVQRALGLGADGVFGIRTARAVDAFQALARLHRSGRVDRSTWRAIFRRPVGSAGSGGPGDAGAAEPGGAAGGAPPTAAPPEVPEPAAPAPGGCSTTLAAPLHGTKTSGFGDGRNHAGVDLAAPVGTAVRAAACGTVNVAGTQSGYGTIVCIRHSTAFVTCYAHLSSMAVSEGMAVGQGQLIGRVGMTGRTTGAHLHFETRVEGVARDPEPYLAGVLTIPGTIDAGGGR